jgi:hypothetical protein
MGWIMLLRITHILLIAFFLSSTLWAGKVDKFGEKVDGKKKKTKSSARKQMEEECLICEMLAGIFADVKEKDRISYKEKGSDSWDWGDLDSRRAAASGQTSSLLVYMLQSGVVNIELGGNYRPEYDFLEGLELKGGVSLFDALIFDVQVTGLRQYAYDNSGAIDGDIIINRLAAGIRLRGDTELVELSFLQAMTISDNWESTDWGGRVVWDHKLIGPFSLRVNGEALGHRTLDKDELVGNWAGSTQLLLHINEVSLYGGWFHRETFKEKSFFEGVEFSGPQVGLEFYIGKR